MKGRAVGWAGGRFVAFTDYQQGSSARSLQHELVAAEAAAAGFEPHQVKAERTIEVQDLLGLADFERKAAYPIDQVPMMRHASQAFVVSEHAKGP